MIRVSIEVSKGPARFSVAVRAESIERALSLIGERYPKGDSRVRLPMAPGGFFAGDTAGHEMAA